MWARRSCATESLNPLAVGAGSDRGFDRRTLNPARQLRAPSAANSPATRKTTAPLLAARLGRSRSPGCAIYTGGIVFREIDVARAMGVNPFDLPADYKTAIRSGKYSKMEIRRRTASGPVRWPEDWAGFCLQVSLIWEKTEEKVEDNVVALKWRPGRGHRRQRAAMPGTQVGISRKEALFITVLLLS
ncbi:hypothetical protein AAFF_G00359680 [Aldrovandia affinis]|uniref:Uncharacterized protein n=1 Tax=Aldrovandia affinis TaxID=143900 RepID=A0AAD7SI62_9TELE|nr:hypothetical protein AAFF_G00359680 [Aldrovandia affinis]